MPTTIFQQKINTILRNDPVKDAILDLFELQMYKNASKNNKAFTFIELYNLLGLEKFMEVMDILAGKTIKFPTREDFKETLQIALCYYYKKYRNYSWDDIKAKLGGDLQTVKFGIKTSQLDLFIKYIGDRVEARLFKEKQASSNIEDDENGIIG